MNTDTWLSALIESVEIRPSAQNLEIVMLFHSNKPDNQFPVVPVECAINKAHGGVQ